MATAGMQILFGRITCHTTAKDPIQHWAPSCAREHRLGSSYSEGHKIKVGKVRTQNGILVFHMQNQSFCSNLSAPIILGIGTRAGDFTKCKCRGVQNEKVQVRAVFVPVEPNNSRYVVIQIASEHPCVDTRHHLSVWEGKWNFREVSGKCLSSRAALDDFYGLSTYIP